VVPVALAQPAAEEAAPSPDQEAIQQAAVEFVEAYGKKDAAAIAALFGPEARMEQADGTVFEGRAEIEAAFREEFEANPKAALSVTMDSIRFVTPDVAVEEGATQYFPDGELLTSQSRYIVLHLKKEGVWRMAAVRSHEREVLSNYEMLRDLEWLVGEWIDEGVDGVVETSCRWDENKSFLLQDIQVRRAGEIDIKASQRIGWDPQAKQFRGWIFDSGGGFGEARWTNTGEEWVSKISGTSNDGMTLSATRTFRLLDRDHIIVDTTDRLAGDERLPDFSITLTRKAPAPQTAAAQ
jgi:uncharacterized protein (TIGR02246 family)